MTKIYTRAYDNYARAQRVVADLETAGIPTDEISLVANKHVSERYADVDDVSGAGTGATVGAVAGGGAGLLAGLGSLAIPGLGPVVAAGWFASTALGAVAGAAVGGLTGALIDAGVPEGDAHVYSESVRRGGTLVTVRTDRMPDRIYDIMDRGEPVVPAERRAVYKKEGWTQFDPDAPPYTPSNAELERIRRTHD